MLFDKCYQITWLACLESGESVFAVVTAKFSRLPRLSHRCWHEPTSCWYLCRVSSISCKHKGHWSNNWRHEIVVGLRVLNLNREADYVSNCSWSSSCSLIYYTHIQTENFSQPKLFLLFKWNQVNHIPLLQKWYSSF